MGRSITNINVAVESDFYLFLLDSNVFFVVCSGICCVFCLWYMVLMKKKGVFVLKMDFFVVFFYVV